MNAKKTRFSAILNAAKQATEAEQDTLEIVPDPILEPPKPEPTSQTEPPSKVVAIAPAPTSKSNSKSSHMKQSTFYIPPELSLDLDDWIRVYNRAAVTRGEAPLDRSDVITRLLQTLVAVGKEKGPEALESLEPKS